MVIMKTETEASFGYPVGPKGKDKEIPFGYTLMSPKRRDNNKERSFLWNMQLQKQWTAPS